jgi:hypothetical protein
MTTTKKPTLPAVKGMEVHTPDGDTISDWLHNQPATKAQKIAEYHEARRVGTAGNAIPDHNKPYRVVTGDGAVWERR